jgi:hypothetical protein
MNAFVLGVSAVSMLLAVAPAYAQAPRALGSSPVVAPEVLEAIERLDCAFTASARGNWSGGAPRVQTTNAGQVDVSLSDIDVLEGSATIRAEKRTASISVRSDRSNLYFLDPGSDGIATLTTVFSQETRPGRLKAVHTRTGRVAAQLYGDCAVK